MILPPIFYTHNPVLACVVARSIVAKMAPKKQWARIQNLVQEASHKKVIDKLKKLVPEQHGRIFAHVQLGACRKFASQSSPGRASRARRRYFR